MAHIWKTIWQRNDIPWILVPRDTKSDLEIYVGQSDLRGQVNKYPAYPISNWPKHPRFSCLFQYMF